MMRQRKDLIAECGLGRKPKLTPHQRREALDRRTAGESLVDIARSYAISHSTISRLRQPGAEQADDQSLGIKPSRREEF
jgi:hypothetical protein